MREERVKISRFNQIQNQKGKILYKLNRIINTQINIFKESLFNLQ